MIRINQIKMPLQYNEAMVHNKILKCLKLKDAKAIAHVELVKRSIDARHKEEVHYSLSVDVTLQGVDEHRLVDKLRDHNISISEEVIYQFPFCSLNKNHQISVIGSGPAGLFAALYLARAGFTVDLYERGDSVENRTKKVEYFWKSGELDAQTNVQFGEGGAGTFSDGKLNTGIKDKTGRIREVLKTFVEFGASPSILYDNKPHVGTDVLAIVVRNMREEILRLGGHVHFNTQIVDFELHHGRITGIRCADGTSIETSCVVLALGHSARDTFERLAELGVMMEAKAFAIGARLEHLQKLFDQKAYGDTTLNLPAADYKVTGKSANGRGVFSFCMCPGGYVVNASSELGMTCVNGMSYAGRTGTNANSAIVVTVDPEDFGSNDILAGIAYQRKLEKAMYQLGQGAIPYQLNEDFQKGVSSTGYGSIIPQIKGQFVPSNLREALPDYIAESIVDGMKTFDKMIHGFDCPEAVFSGIESRTSSPVRILRGESLESVNVSGLYPCGEGAGYAGGITSAAVDGIKVAEAIALRYGQ